MVRIRFWLLIAGITLLVLGWQEWQLSKVVRPQAQTIPYARLVRDGYGDNAHVRLTECFLAPGDYVYEASGSRWTKVFAPLVSSEGEYATRLRELPEGASPPKATSFGVILLSEHVHGEDEIDPLYGLKEFTGIVINEIESLGGREKRLLEESYPGVDLDRCWILDHARRLPSGTLGAVLLVVGVVLGGLAGLHYLLWRAPKPQDPQPLDESASR